MVCGAALVHEPYALPSGRRRHTEAGPVVADSPANVQQTFPPPYLPIWGYEKPKKPAAAEPDAPSAAETSAQGLKYEPYKPFQSKYKHYVGGAYKRGDKFAAEVGVNWLEGGDTGKTLGLPTDPKSKFGKVERRDGNVFYFEPEGHGRGAKRRITAYKIMIFHPERELYVIIRVQAAQAASMQAFVKKGQALYATYESKARPRP